MNIDEDESEFQNKLLRFEVTAYQKELADCRKEIKTLYIERAKFLDKINELRRNNDAIKKDQKSIER